MIMIRLGFWVAQPFSAAIKAFLTAWASAPDGPQKVGFWVAQRFSTAIKAFLTPWASAGGAQKEVEIATGTSGLTLRVRALHRILRPKPIDREFLSAYAPARS